MSARSFRSVFMVASCAGAALGCYLVSLRVASERAALEDVETEIVLAQRDIRLLQTEIGTRGRLAQLERWNVKVLALSAPSADQFLNGGFELAKMVAPDRRIDIEAPVVLASAPINSARPQAHGLQPRADQPAREGASAKQLMHVASLKRDTGEQSAIISLKPGPAGTKAITDKPAPTASKPKSGTPVKTAVASSMKAAAADKKAPASDPLAPLAPAKPKKLASVTSKDAATKQ